jgi:small subunit ribosomal protein S16
MLKIRLRRVGGTNAPAYRIVVSDSRRTPTAKVVEELGHYDPTRNPPTSRSTARRRRRGSRRAPPPSETVRKLIAKPA